jgi:hypothetical protein
MKTQTEKPKGKGACPSHLFARWRDIRHGGARGYKDFGSEVMKGVRGILFYEHDEEIEGNVLAQLESLVDARDDEGILGWFDREVPRIMALVPPKRRARLLMGMYEAIENEGADIFS